MELRPSRARTTDQVAAWHLEAIASEAIRICRGKERQARADAKAVRRARRRIAKRG